MKEADYNKTGKAVTVSQFMALAGSDYKVRVGGALLPPLR